MIVSSASYPLDWVKQFFKNGNWLVSQTAIDGALALGFDEDDIFECVLNNLSDTHFYKTMPSEKKPELMQDVYRITYGEQRIYLKLQVADNWATVISFKEE